MKSPLDNDGGLKVVPLLRELSVHANVYIFGGAARDSLFSNESLSPKDFDIVYVGNREKVERVIQKFYIKHNRFGGMKMIYNNTSVDIWNIDDSFYLKNAKDKSITKLLDTTYSNLESVVYDFNFQEYLYSEAFTKARKDNTIEILNPINTSPLYAAIKTIKNSLMFNLRLSDSAKMIIKSSFIQFHRAENITATWNKCFESELTDSVFNELSETGSLSKKSRIIRKVYFENRSKIFIKE